jgi:hypothetical protein
VQVQRLREHVQKKHTEEAGLDPASSETPDQAQPPEAKQVAYSLHFYICSTNLQVSTSLRSRKPICHTLQLEVMFLDFRSILPQ